MATGSSTSQISRQDRADFSKRRLQGLRRKLSNLVELSELPRLSIYATGSYARGEASEHSDIDLFFLHGGSERDSRVSRLSELKVFARVIEIGAEMGFPTFSNDGEYLRILYIDDLLSQLGGREDDFRNYFTARMLLLLESHPLFNEVAFDAFIGDILEAYFRDYPDHNNNFKAVFLINDIIRFWKTLCLNYEHRRNRPPNDPEKRIKQQVKNFKLKFSRMMTCYGSVAAICAHTPPIDSSSVSVILRNSPLERFLNASALISELEATREAVIDDYSWFLSLTSLSTDELTKHFSTKGEKRELFRRADVFGERVYDIVRGLAARNHYERFLVI